MANAWAMLPLNISAVTAGSTAAGYDAANMLNDFGGVVWRSAGGSASVAIVVDFGVAQNVDTALFFGCTDARTSWTLTVESADNAGFVGATTHASGVGFLAGAIFPTHGRGVGYWTQNPGGAARRYWRFTIGNLGNAAVTIARLALGRRIQLARNFGFGGALGVRDLGRVERSAAGVLLRRRAAKLRVLSLTFPAVYKSEIETAIQPLLEMIAGQEPIVICTDPDVNSLRQQRCWMGLLTGDLGVVWSSAVRWEWRASLIDLITVPAGTVTPGTPIFSFVGAAVPTGATFVRSTTGRFFNASGVLASAAVDAARFDYDPASLVYRGLLIEPAATNTMINSEDLATGGSLVSGTVTVNDRVAPDGATTADRFTASGSGARFQRFSSLTQGVQQTSSIWLFSASTVSGNMVIYDGGTGAGAGATQAFTLPANTWTRVSVTGTPTGTDRRVWVEFPTGTPTVWAWGWQTETGAVPTSYIPTTGSSVTRAADVMTLNWGSVGVPDGTITARFTFDDSSTQDVSTTVSAGVSVIPTNLTRRWVRSVEVV